jgi:hypothetical protein
MENFSDIGLFVINFRMSRSVIRSSIERCATKLLPNLGKDGPWERLLPAASPMETTIRET